MKKKTTDSNPLPAAHQGIRVFTIDDRERLRCPWVPTIGARVHDLECRLSLMRAALIGLGSDLGSDDRQELDDAQVRQTIESLGAQARQALEELFYLTELDDDTLHILAPTPDDRKELEAKDAA